jgi:hypothetical protein
MLKDYCAAVDRDNLEVRHTRRQQQRTSYVESMKNITREIGETLKRTSL